MKVLVTGANGQLGRCIYDSVEHIFGAGCLNNEYYFATHDDFDITDKSSMINYIYCNFIPDCIINCAAYTNVEQAEDDEYSAFMVNSYGVKNLTDICEEHDIMLIHISTDYVYKDNNSISNEESEIEPLNIYGQSKRDGEIHILNSNLKRWYIFRTSWLYSEYGNNFFTKILAQYRSYELIYGVIDEIGSPTYARKLADMIVNLIEEQLYVFYSPYEISPGIYNFSGVGICSRYDFASIILNFKYNSGFLSFKNNGFLSKNTVHPITQDNANKIFGFKAKRPKFILINNSKIEDSYSMNRNSWMSDLDECIKRFDELEKRKNSLNKI